MNWFTLVVVGVIGFVLVRLVFVARPSGSLEEARADIDAGRAFLVDVREPAEWAQGVVEHALLLPYSDLRRERTRWSPVLEHLRGKKLLLYCRSGARSGMAAAQLRKEGFDAANAGSLGRWRRAGWVMIRPKLDA